MAVQPYASSPIHWVEGAVTASDQDSLPPLTVTGARDDGTALTSLLTQLEKLGLVIDSTTAT